MIKKVRKTFHGTRIAKGFYAVAVLFSICMIYSDVYAQQEPVKPQAPVVINFMRNDNVPYTRWDAVADYNKIKRWAQTRHLEVIPDSEPVVDKTAAFVSQYGSGVSIDNLDPNRNYTLYIDFVSYKGGNGGITSRLVITAEDERLAELNFGENNSGGYYRIQIPRNIVFDGKLDLKFDEAATTSGVWGIWDMVLTDGELPSTMSVKKTKPEVTDKSDKILDDKGSPRKKIKRREVVNRKQTGPEPKENKGAGKIVEPAIKDIQEPGKPGEPQMKKPESPEINEKNVKEPSVKVPDIRD